MHEPPTTKRHRGSVRDKAAPGARSQGGRGATSVSAALEPILRPFKGIFGARGSFSPPSAHPPDIELGQDGDFEARGVHPRDAHALQGATDQTGWDIYLRGAHPSRLIHLSEVRSAYGPARPKPPGVYQKTTKDGAFAGLVVYGPDEDDRFEADKRRLQDLFGLRLHLDDNRILRDEWGNAFYSDLDLHVVFKKDGEDESSVVPMEVWLPVLSAAVQAIGLYGQHQLAPGTPIERNAYGVFPYSPFQHGGHAEWTERNSEKSGANRGPIPGEVRFSPGKTAVYFDTTPRTREDFKEHNQEHVYTGASWDAGRNRKATERYTRRHSSPDPLRFHASTTESSTAVKGPTHRK
jgi:insecticidal toxin complex protein TccC